jgi:hypothetical protein
MVEAKKGKKNNFIFGIAIVLLLIAVFVVYSALQTPVTTGGQRLLQTQNGVQPDLTQPTVEPTLTQSTVEPQATQTPANEGQVAISGECKLFKNKYTSEYRCLGCVVDANNPNPECFRTSRDWSEVSSGTSGYYCVWDETFELGCRTLKA